MKPGLRTAAIAGMLALSVAAAAPAREGEPEDDAVCTGRAPFREMAQDEIYSFRELCSMREDFRREDRARTRAGAVGWAKGRGSPPPRKD